MAVNAMNTTQLACWIPEYQSAKALSALEKSLVIQKCVWSDWRQYLKFGDILDIPIVPDLGTADSVNLNVDLELNAQTTTRKQIAVNQWNYKAVGVGYREQMQNYPDYLAATTEKCSYSVSKAIDYYLATWFNNLTAGNVGTLGSALTDDIMLTANENLDKADVSEMDRFLVVDPESITDLFKIDKFLRDDYVRKGAVESPAGLVGRSIYGCTVYMSNNLEAHSTAHWAAMFQREAIGVIIQQNPTVKLFDWPEKHTSVVEVSAIHGSNVLRPTAGVCINTRS